MVHSIHERIGKEVAPLARWRWQAAHMAKAHHVIEGLVGPLLPHN
jgi:hypothetical protein